MDREVRGRLANATQAARSLLEHELAEQLEGVFDLRADAPEPYEVSSSLASEDRLTRDRIEAALSHKRAAGLSASEAFADYLRDAAYTVLHRFVALKLLEVRGLVQECISRGEQSAGFREFCGMAPGLAQLSEGQAYRLYLESLFDELAQEVALVFDRRDVAALVWPGRRALDALLALLNAPDLANAWREEETLGWVYQYFHRSEERREMREAGPPRNSRELAVRNQFFTPRYVVEFLVDNTLGRRWLTMRSGQSRLAEICSLLLEDPPLESVAKKDPRDLRILDPACGSAHFLLYAFGLLLTIYEEAWEDPASPASEETGRTLRDDYPEIGALRRAVPVLVLRHNLFGVDIDARCAQIAALALWLRAQRAYDDWGIARGERPPVTKTHLVVAEPVPAAQDLLAELKPTLRPAVLGQLLETFVAKLELAGEVGSLLRVEAEMAEAIEAARREFVAEQAKRREDAGFLPGLAPPRRQPGLFDFADLDDEAFFERAEELLVEALDRFATEAGGREGTRRRLFRDDAASGIALVHLLRQRYDAILMNPPFGEVTSGARTYLRDELGRAAGDVGGAFVAAARRHLTEGGLVGVLLSTAAWFKPTWTGWREQELLGAEYGLRVAAHLGGGVLDATVSASAFVTGPRASSDRAVYFRHIRDAEKEAELRTAVSTVRGGTHASKVFRVSAEALRRYRKAPLTYWISEALREKLATVPAIEGNGAEIRVGLQTSDEERFVRAWWEVLPVSIGLKRTWAPFTKSSEYSPFWDDITWVVNWEDDGREIRAFDRSKPQNTGYFGRPGATYPARSVIGFNPRVQPTGGAFGHMGSVAFPLRVSAQVLLGYLGSRPLEYVLSFSIGSLQGEAGVHPNHYEVGLIQDLPWPALTPEQEEKFDRAAETASTAARELQRDDERAHSYMGRPGLIESKSVRDIAEASWKGKVAAIEEIERGRAALDRVAEEALGFRDEDRKDMEAECATCVSIRSGPWAPEFRAALSDERIAQEAAALLSEMVGFAFGRFDVRVPRGERKLDELSSPFDPLPVRSPAMLDAIPDGYPLVIPSDGIVVDDAGHPLDLVALLERVFEATFGARGSEMAREAVALATDEGTDLRTWLRRSFFADHVGRYTKGRRRAPVYWQLTTPSRSYSIVLCAPRISKDTLYKVLHDHVGPKLSHEERRLGELQGEAGGKPTPSQRRVIAELEGLIEELRGFREEIERVTPIWDPDPDDGVVVNCAPLWRLFPQHRPWQEECRKAWEALVEGKLDWANLAMRLFPERVVPKCRSDRSLAVAHGLEERFWVLGERPVPRPGCDVAAEDEIRSRTSPAVRAALENLRRAGASGAPGRARGPRRARRR